MTEPNDAIRDLVQRAHEEEPHLIEFDPDAGLADLRSRVPQQFREAGEGDAGAGLQQGALLMGPDFRTRPHGGSAAEPHSEDRPPRRLSRVSAFAMPESDDGVPELVGVTGLVRPYMRTRGRTRAPQFALEALVVTAPGLDPATVRSPEWSRVCELCVRPTAVAEIAARLEWPFGVARVVIADVVDAGLATVILPQLEEDGGPSLALMAVVLERLREM